MGLFATVYRASSPLLRIAKVIVSERYQIVFLFIPHQHLYRNPGPRDHVGVSS
jgi:hypothetical protein